MDMVMVVIELICSNKLVSKMTIIWGHAVSKLLETQNVHSPTHQDKAAVQHQTRMVTTS